MTAEQLKNSILQMAVQGKLVPQDPNDEPASELIKRIREEKERLIKEGKIKKEKNPSYIFRGEDNIPYEKVGKNEPVSIADEVPFEIPESWEWCRCSTLGTMIRGKGIKRSETVKEGFPCVRYGEIYTSYNISFEQAVSFIPEDVNVNCIHFNHRDVLFTLTGENKPDIAKAITYTGNVPVAAGGDLAYWTAHGMNPFYLVYFLSSPYAVELKRRTATGDIIVHISTSKVGNFLIPVPPLEEQNRIVDRIQEIEPYIKRYKSISDSSDELNVSFPEKLKKSILQEAVMGKLVSQNENDEPASVLLERIREEKQRLIAEGKLKKNKHESFIYRRDNSHYEKIDGNEVCIDDEIPYDIPDNWNWCRIRSIFNLQAGKNIQSSQIHENSNGKDYLCYGGNGTRGYVDGYNHVGDYPIIGRQGALCGNINRATGKFYATEHAVCVDTFANTDVSWACLFLTALNLNQYATATAQPGLAVTNINEVLIPLPPLSEQARIVSKLESIISVLATL